MSFVVYWFGFDSRMKQIHKVAVLGAGTMGARISAHLANAGIPSFLLDIVPPGAAAAASRSKLAVAGLDASRKAKPAAFFEPGLASLVTVGNFEDDLKRVAEADWIIEAVVEDLEIKRALLKRVDALRKPGTIITTNTSGLPVTKIAEGFPDDFRRCWFGTHFFNPPRYMRLLEIIPTADADSALMDVVAGFADFHLGKGVVFAKDTPNFIANRIGTYSALNVMRLMQEFDLTIEEVDALTGPVLGWPRSATFRTIDMVGLDILGHVVRNANDLDERRELKLPDFFQKMLERKMLGDKSGGGFYKKVKGASEDERLALDWKTLEYRPQQKAKFASLEITKNIDDPGTRLRALLSVPGKSKDEQFLWAALSELWTYSANRIPEISDTVVEIDRAMRLGFNWELGPFELWDAAGVEATVARMKKEARPVAPNVEKLLAAGKKSWYEDDPSAASGRTYFDLASSSYKPVKAPPGVWSVAVAKKSNGVVKKNSGASLVDLGDGVGCIEFHSKMNTLGADIVQLISQTLRSGGAGDSFEAFVITNGAPNFSVGANLMLLLMSVQDEDWDEV
ncbi:MAG TPA: 3-hydroxyacyl-CoA dehydrogenase NAD-binding domain-containing protein, partial [Terriglobales bacterium]